MKKASISRGCIEHLKVAIACFKKYRDLRWGRGFFTVKLSGIRLTPLTVRLNSSPAIDSFLCRS